VLGSELKLGERVSLEVEGGYGQADASFEWRDAYVFVDLPNRMEFSLGKMKPRFGLAHFTSLKNLAMGERPLATDLLGLARAPGAAFALSAGAWRVDIGAYRGQDDEGSRIESAVARAVYEHEADTYWHVGLSAASEDYDRAIYRVSSRAETDVMDNFLRSEKITAEHVDYAGLDAVWQRHRFTLQAEFIGNKVRSPKEGDRRYTGGYLQGSLFLTADQHDFADGKVGALEPEARTAWELVATYSTLDALSRNDGFDARVVTAGVNFYYGPHVKVMAELKSLKIDAGAYEDEAGRAALLRFQFRF
jgi:phosphate-selective porin